MDVIVVDDEAPARRLLKKLLQGDPELKVVGEGADGRQAVNLIVEHQPDLVFLDIQMPTMDGIAVIQEVGPTAMPAVIFVTAFDQYAIRAFEAHALDYLLKPFSHARFTEAVSRAKRLILHSQTPQSQRLRGLLHVWQFDHRPPDDRSAGSSFRQRILVKDRHRIIRLELADILWLEAADHYVVLHTLGGKHLLPESLSALENSLPPSRFVRIHRGAVVNVAHVQEITSLRFGRCRVTLKTGEQIQLSRARRQVLKTLLSK